MGHVPELTDRRLPAGRSSHGGTAHGVSDGVCNTPSGSVGLGLARCHLDQERGEERGALCIISKRKASQPEANGIVRVCQRLCTMPPGCPWEGWPATICGNWAGTRGQQMGKHLTQTPAGSCALLRVPGHDAAAKGSKVMPAVTRGSPRGVSWDRNSEEGQGQGCGHRRTSSPVG